MKQIIQWEGFRRYSIPAFVIIIVVVASLLLSSISSGLAAPPGKYENRYLIRGQLVSSLKHHTPIHATQDSAMLNLSIALNPRNADGLDRLIAAQNDPRSPLYHRYITPQEFTNLFGPAPSAVNEVVDYLRSQKLRVHSVSSNRLLIQASGSVENVERAFNVALADYNVNGRIVYAPTSEPSVPRWLADMILNVAGLDNVARYHRSGKLNVRKGIEPHEIKEGGYTPIELRTAYNITPLFNRGYEGSGQTIAFVELDGYSASDIDTFLDYYHLGSPKYSHVLLDGATTAPGKDALEVELDMEIASAIAPGAEHRVYIGRNDAPGVYNIYNRIVSDNVAKIVSISWGACEAAMGESALKTLNTIFKQGVAQGIAFFAASGDAGVYDCGDENMAVDSPASDPYVVGVGGTTLRIGEDGNYLSESAWSCESCKQYGPLGSGSGGGFSSFFERPAYQKGHNIPYGRRAVPDVSANADIRTGYSVYCTVSAAGCPPSGWIVVGGTSAAAPLWAGVAAVLNHYLMDLDKPTLGSASAQLYSLYRTVQPYEPFHDITTGDNLYYQAGPGYDLTTGLGTPNVWNIARDLAASFSDKRDEDIKKRDIIELLARPDLEDSVPPRRGVE